MTDELTSWRIIDWISGISAVVSLIGFFFTLWQVWGVKKQIRQASEQTKTKMQQALNLTLVADMGRTAELLMNALANKKWDRALSFMTEINKALIEISTYDEVEAITRSSFKTAIQRLPTDLCQLRLIACEEEQNTDIRFVIKNLQTIQDNLKLIEIYLKKQAS